MDDLSLMEKEIKGTEKGERPEKVRSRLKKEEEEEDSGVHRKQGIQLWRKKVEMEGSHGREEREEAGLKQSRC